MLLPEKHFRHSKKIFKDKCVTEIFGSIHKKITFELLNYHEPIVILTSKLLARSFFN